MSPDSFAFSRPNVHHLYRLFSWVMKIYKNYIEINISKLKYSKFKYLQYAKDHTSHCLCVPDRRLVTDFFDFIIA